MEKVQKYMLFIIFFAIGGLFLLRNFGYRDGYAACEEAKTEEMDKLYQQIYESEEAYSELEHENYELQEKINELDEDLNDLHLAYNRMDEQLYFWSNHAVIVTPAGGTYHRYGCNQIDPDHLYIYNVETAIAKGYEPCLACDPPTR